MTNNRINELVAEHVMGWTWRNGVIAENQLIDAGWCDENGLVETTTPDFQHTWEGAGLVAERMQELQPGWRFALVGGDESFGNRWKAEWFGHLDPKQDCGQRHGHGWADSAPEAICLAALSALGVEG